MPRGGRRSGTPGKGYGQRTDLLTNRAPMPASSGPPPPPVAPQDAQPLPVQQGPMLPQPGTIAKLTDPTTRPDEPLTAGLGQQPEEDTLSVLRAVYLRYPSEDLRQLIAELERG